MYDILGPTGLREGTTGQLLPAPARRTHGAPHPTETPPHGASPRGPVGALPGRPGPRPPRPRTPTPPTDRLRPAAQNPGRRDPWGRTPTPPSPPAPAPGPARTLGPAAQRSFRAWTRARSACAPASACARPGPGPGGRLGAAVMGVAGRSLS